MVLKLKIARALAAIILGVSGVQGAALAACLQSDGAGSWQAYAITAEGGGAFWTRCRLSINSVGTIATNTCTRSDGVTGSMTNGHINLVNATRCTFTGSFNLGGALNTIRHSTLSRDKISVEGVGTFPGGIFSFNLTKL